MTKNLDSQEYWDKKYRVEDDRALSWFEEGDTVSFNWVVDFFPNSAAVADIGGGKSALIPSLLKAGYKRLTHVEWSESASVTLQHSLGSAASEINWFIGDLKKWRSGSPVDLWHDRAVFHFCTDEGSIAAYLDALHDNVKENGHALLATFHLDGPDKCSGLSVQRYNEVSLIETLQGFNGSKWTRIKSLIRTHQTPALQRQKFQYLLARRDSS